MSAALGPLALAACLAAAPPAAAGVFNPVGFKLDNGLEVVVLENSRAPIVMQMVWYRVGAADERPGEVGLAHLVEHLMFRGTKSLGPGEFSRIVARIGGRDNAFTSYDYSAYFQRVAAHELETVMRIEADRMRNLALSDGVVMPEREVVLEERRSRTDNRPAAQLRERMRRLLYLNHPYGRPVIGWETEIRQLTTDKALAFYRRHYVPENAMLIVAGDVTPDRVEELAREHYGPIPSRAAPARERGREPPHLAPRRVTLTSERVRQPSWSRLYLVPDFKDRLHALEIFAELLGGGSTSRLYRRLVVERGLAAGAGAWFSGDSRDYAEFGLYATPRPGGDVEALETALAEELEAALEDGFEAQDVRRAKRLMASAAVYARDGLRAGPMAIGRAFAVGRTIEDVESWPDRIAAVTGPEVMSAARKALDLSRSVTGVLLPAKP